MNATVSFVDLDDKVLLTVAWPFGDVLPAEGAQIVLEDRIVFVWPRAYWTWDPRRAMVHILVADERHGG